MTSVMRTPASSPSLVLYGGPIYTVDESDRVVEAIAIRDGRILAAGSTADVRGLAGPTTRQVDIAGLAVVPGFVDGHPHMDAVGQRLLRPSFGKPTSIDDVIAVIREEVVRRRPGEWIVCNPIAEEPDVFRFPAALREGRWPTRHDLDRVSPANPVFIHAPILVAPGIAIANTEALRRAGTTGRMSPPDGVEIETDEAGAPTGVFKDFNFPKVVAPALFPALPNATGAEMVEAVRSGMTAFNAAGITAIYEGHGLPSEAQQAYLALWSERALTVRTYFVIQYPTRILDDEAAGDALIRETAKYAAGPGFGDDWLKFGGLGFSFDSGTSIGASVMRAEYPGARGYMWRGIQYASDARFRSIFEKAARAGLRVQVQCAGGGATDKVLAMYEEIDRVIPLSGRRWVIEHCQFPSPENMALCRRLNVIPTSTTNFLWLHGSQYLARYGRDLTSDAVPFKPWLDAGVRAVQSTDGRPYDPLFTLWQSLARRDGLTGQVLSTPRQKLSRAEALRIYTANGAYAVFGEDRFGTIEPGKLADLAILSRDIMTIDEDEIPTTTVMATLVGGRVVHDRGVFGGVDDTARRMPEAG